MKRRDLIKRFEQAGWVLIREGGEHTIYGNGKQKEQIPRHREINEVLARNLIKKHGL
jgi:mRNA interferase HicA